jgi:hypothetical protein
MSDEGAPGAAGVVRWLLWPNLGAEEGPDWPRHAAHGAVAATARLWRLLFPAAHRVIGPVDLGDERWPAALGERPPGAAFRWLDARPGAHAWLGDQAAVRALVALGADWSGPDPAATRAVHDKAFAQDAAERQGRVPRILRGLAIRFEPEDLEDPAAALARVEQALSAWPDWTRGRFVLKPRLGSSGRGRVSGRRDALDARALRGAFPRLAARGGAILEPWLERAADLSVALVVAPAADPDPGVTLLGSLESVVTPAGVPLGHVGEIDSRGRVASGRPEDEQAREAAAEIAAEARAAGWFGAGGVDSLVFLDPRAEDERPILRGVVELNARPTLGLIAIGLLRRLLPRLRAEHGLGPGERRGFAFALRPPGGSADWSTAARAAGDGVIAVPLAGGAEGAATGPGILVGPDRAPLRALFREAAPGA